MQTLFSSSLEPDLSLNISPPSISDSHQINGITKALYHHHHHHQHNDNICSISTTSDSASSESELSHENPFIHHHHHHEPTLRLGFGNSDLMNPHHHNHHLHHHQAHAVSRNFIQPHIYGRDFKRNTRTGVKRSVRAPRMRWTTTLHSHFVHAVQLLGGHESK